MKKIVILFLIIPSLIFITGCNKTEYESVLATEITGVFKTTVIPLPENYGVLNPASYCDGIFITDLFYSDDAGESYYNNLNRKTLTFTTDGSSVYVTDAEATDNYTTRWIFSNIQFVVKSDFSVYYMVDDEIFTTIDLPSILNCETNVSSDADSFSILEIIPTYTNEYYILTTAGLVLVSSSGEIRWSQTEIGDLSDIAMTDHGLIGLCIKETNSVWFLDESTGSAIIEIEMPPQVIYGSGIGGANNTISLYSGNSEFDFYVVTGQAIFGIVLSEQKDNSIFGSATEWLNWLNSDINPKNISNLCIADNTITAIYSDTDENQLFLLTKIPDDEIVPKKILSLAFLSEDSGINNVIFHAIEDFNRSNSEYRIITTDFTTYDKDIRHTIFGAELASGNIPDIVILSTSSTQDTSISNYVNSDIFCNLLPYMESNSSFDHNNLLGYVTTPFTTNGEQNIFPLKPSVETEFGTAAYFSEPLTIEETFLAIDSLPTNVYWSTNAVGFKRTTLQSILHDFVDFQAGSCAFDSDTFAYAIRKLHEISDDTRITGVSTRDEYFSIIHDEKLRLVSYAPTSLYNYAKLNFYLDGEAVAVGFPNQEKKLFVQNMPGTYFAVTEGCEAKDTAFDFINYIYNSFGETDYNDGNYAFFTQDIYRQADKYINKTFVVENGQIRSYEDNEIPADTSNHFKITDSTADEYIAFLNSIDAILPTDSPLYSIVQEEFYGYENRKPEETVKVIQSRASIYMSEQYQ